LHSWRRRVIAPTSVRARIWARASGDPKSMENCWVWVWVWVGVDGVVEEEEVVVVAAAVEKVAADAIGEGIERVGDRSLPQNKKWLQEKHTR